IPAGMKLEFTATPDGDVFHGWSGGSGFTGSASSVDVTIPGLPTPEVFALAAFWTAAAKVDLAGPTQAVAGQVTSADPLFRVRVLDADDQPTRVTANTIVNLTSSGAATF